MPVLNVKACSRICPRVICLSQFSRLNFDKKYPSTFDPLKLLLFLVAAFPETFTPIAERTKQDSILITHCIVLFY